MRGVLLDNSLNQQAQPLNPVDLRGEKAFFGMGLSQQVPIDVLAINFLSNSIDNFSILLVDEFHKLNGTSKEEIDSKLKKTIDTLNNINELYGLNNKIILSSEFMNSTSYLEGFQDVKSRILDQGLEEEVLATVPKNKRTKSGLLYPLHEIACVKYLGEQGFTRKIGPSKEKVYDRIMAKIGLNTDFSYLLNAYALGTKSLDEVIHYVPSSKGPNNGQRIYLGEGVEKIKAKLQGHDDALRYYGKLGLMAKALIKGKELDIQEVKNLENIYSKKLRKYVSNPVINYVVNPLSEVRP